MIENRNSQVPMSLSHSHVTARTRYYLQACRYFGLVVGGGGAEERRRGGEEVEEGRGNWESRSARGVPRNGSKFWSVCGNQPSLKPEKRLPPEGPECLTSIFFPGGEQIFHWGKKNWSPILLGNQCFLDIFLVFFGEWVEICRNLLLLKLEREGYPSFIVGSAVVRNFC